MARRSAGGLVLMSMLGLAGCKPEGTEPPDSSVASLPTCDGADQLAELWSPDRRASFIGALEASPGEWPRQLLAAMDERMPRFATLWTDAYARACELELVGRKRCLDAQAWRLDALLELIVEDPDRAPALWPALADPRVDPLGCMDATIDAPPLTPARGRALASLFLLIDLGELAEAERVLAELEADPAVADVDAYAWRLALTRAQVEAAAARPDAAMAALARAEALVDDLDAGVRAALADARADLAEAGDDPAAAELARQQAIAAAREQTDPWLLIDQLIALGRARLERGEPREAAAPLVEAIALAGRIGGFDNPRTAELQTVLAQAQLELGQLEAASDALTQARDTFVIALGPDHPRTLATVEAVGRLFVIAGRPGDAQFAFLDLLEVYTDLYGVKDWRTAKIKLELADSLMTMEQHESAQRLYTEALTPLAQELGVVDPLVVRASIHLGVAELALGDLEAAQLHCGRGGDLANALGVGDPLREEAARCLSDIAERSAPARKRRSGSKPGTDSGH